MTADRIHIESCSIDQYESGVEVNISYKERTLKCDDFESLEMIFVERNADEIHV